MVGSECDNAATAAERQDMRKMSIREAIDGIEGASWVNTHLTDHGASDIYWLDYRGTRVGYRLNEVGKPILIDRHWYKIVNMGNAVATDEDPADLTAHGLLALLSDALAEDALEVPDEADISRWWDTYNAALIGAGVSDTEEFYDPNPCRTACHFATTSHGFTPENYRGPRPEKESKS